MKVVYMVVIIVYPVSVFFFYRSGYYHGFSAGFQSCRRVFSKGFREHRDLSGGKYEKEKEAK